MRRARILCWCLALISAICPLLNFDKTALAQESDIELVEVVSGLSSPIYLTNAHDGSNRLFIVEQDGRIKVLGPGSTAPQVFLNITSKVLSGGERGLLGLAFHPQFSTNRRFFVNYTRRPDGATVIAEYQASAPNPNVAETDETRAAHNRAAVRKSQRRDDRVRPGRFSLHSDGRWRLGK